MQILYYNRYYMNFYLLYFIQMQKYGILFLSLNAWIEICIMYYKSWAYLLDKPFLMAYKRKTNNIIRIE